MGEIIPILKSRNEAECTNLRALSLLDVVHVMITIIKVKLDKTAEPQVLGKVREQRPNSNEGMLTSCYK